VLHRFQKYIREHDLLRPGERVAVAVSGGADSVALLRLLLELRQELGIVLSVAHVNHQLRGSDAERDAAFVAELAERHGLEFHLAVRDVRAYAVEHKLSLEAAGRRLRYAFFSALVEERKADKIATAHTLDDQAETVLLKLLRGSWLRGLAGIHPRLRAEDGRIWVVRPLLGTGRREVEAYLQRLAQPWREDLSNLDHRFRRNRVRQLMPQLEAEHHPGVRATLAQIAELARAEESYWAEKVAEIAPGLISHHGAESVTVDSELLAAQPLAVQRRLLRFAGEQVQLKLGFEEVERLRLLLAAHGGSRCELPAGWRRESSEAGLSLACEYPVFPLARTLAIQNAAPPLTNTGCGCRGSWQSRRLAGSSSSPGCRLPRAAPQPTCWTRNGLKRSLRSGIGALATATIPWAMSARKR
jgi:tRNA(Ile)-lysidine synthase